MPTINVPNSVSVSVMKKAGQPAVEVDLSKLSEGAIQNALQQGIKYFFDARLSHKAKATGEAAESAAESVQKVLDRLYAPEWIVRQRSEASEDELSLEDRAFLMALTPRFQKAGVIWRANKKAGKEARTVLEVVDELGGAAENAWEVAAKAVATDYLTKEKMDPALIPAKVDGAWKKIQAEAKDHLKSLKAQQVGAFD